MNPAPASPDTRTVPARPPASAPWATVPPSATTSAFVLKSPLCILHLEDEPNDARLIQGTLEAAGIVCAITRVVDQAQFVSVLEGGGIDLVLSDYSLPTFDGLSAIQLAHERWPDLPVILVSGTLAEDVAIDTLKSGATDYVLKDRLTRLAPAVVRAMRDVAERLERRRLEGQFIEVQKMEVVGQFAGGIAHDFNNILAIIMGYSDLISIDVDPTSTLRKYNDEIRLASERAAGLTRQLLVFSRKQEVIPAVLDLNDVVKDMENMLRRLIDENIELIIAPGNAIGQILADAGYVGQVLMNLVVNARDAMPSGGKLTIATANVTLAEAADLIPAGAAAGDYVMLSVSDTGVGMTDEVRCKLFTAFFTTKPAGKGTGLGLATCKTIVHQSGGHIGVESEVGRGTTFRIYFPRVQGGCEVTERPALDQPMPRGTETLLVVEDEPSVRNLARGVLASLGYEVLSASNGQDALHVTANHKGFPIRLVITDVIMPTMDGKVMAEWLKTTLPDLKVLFTSGYTDDTITHHGVLEAGVEFLPKPYTPATLARKVRQLLDNSAKTRPDAGTRAPYGSRPPQ